MELWNNMVILGSQNGDGNDSHSIKKYMLVFKANSSITAQTKGVYVKSLYHSFPLTDMDSAFCQNRFPGMNQSDIGSGTTHVDDDTAVCMGKLTAAYHAGCRTT